MAKKIIMLGMVLIAVILIAGCEGVNSPTGELILSEDSNTTAPDTSEPQTQTCPTDCDDSNMCTVDTCSEITNYKCKHDPLPNCCGNAICEGKEGENRDTCPADCEKPAKSCTSHGECDDGDPCTVDACTQGKCTNVPEAGVICVREVEEEEFVGTAGAGIQVTAQYVKSVAGQKYVIGVVKNIDVVNYEDIEVTATALMYTDDVISVLVPIAKETDETIIDILAPGAGSPFAIFFEKGIVDIDEIRVEVTDYKETSDTPYQKLKLKTTPQRSYEDHFGYDRVSYDYELKLENTGTKTATGVKVYTITQYGGIQEHAPPNYFLAPGKSFQIGDEPFPGIAAIPEVYIQTDTLE